MSMMKEMMEKMIAGMVKPEDMPAMMDAMMDHRTMFADDELKWPVKQRFRVSARLLRSLAGDLALELGHTAARTFGRYDVAPASTLGA